MVDRELLEILRCPHCAPLGAGGELDLVKDVWLACRQCGRKYPIRQEIPVMLVEVGSRWIDTPAEALPVPPPES